MWGGVYGVRCWALRMCNATLARPWLMFPGLFLLWSVVAAVQFDACFESEFAKQNRTWADEDRAQRLRSVLWVADSVFVGQLGTAIRNYSHRV